MFLSAANASCSQRTSAQQSARLRGKVTLPHAEPAKSVASLGTSAHARGQGAPVASLWGLSSASNAIISTAPSPPSSTWDDLWCLACTRCTGQPCRDKSLTAATTNGSPTKRRTTPLCVHDHLLELVNLAAWHRDRSRRTVCSAGHAHAPRVPINRGCAIRRTATRPQRWWRRDVRLQCHLKLCTERVRQA